jgi:hypothetical protein
LRGTKDAIALWAAIKAGRSTPMRMFLQVQMAVKATNRAIEDGSLSTIIDDFITATKPEGVWFSALGGQRAMIAVFDLVSPSQIPRLAEPFFSKLNASFVLSPAMNLEDLKAAGVSP